MPGQGTRPLGHNASPMCPEGFSQTCWTTSLNCDPPSLLPVQGWTYPSCRDSLVGKIPGILPQASFSQPETASLGCLFTTPELVHLQRPPNTHTQTWIQTDCPSRVHQAWHAKWGAFHPVTCSGWAFTLVSCCMCPGKRSLLRSTHNCSAKSWLHRARDIHSYMYS